MRPSSRDFDNSGRDLFYGEIMSETLSCEGSVRRTRIPQLWVGKKGHWKSVRVALLLSSGNSSGVSISDSQANIMFHYILDI